MATAPTASEGMAPPTKVRRVISQMACDACRRSKLRCDISALITTSSEAECTRCKSAGKTCIVGEPPKRGRRRATSQIPNSLGDDRLDKNPRLVSPLRDLPSLDSAALGLFTPPTPSETALFQAPPPKAQPDNVLLGTQSPLMLLADASHLAGHTSTGPGSLTLAEGASLRGVNIDRAVLAEGLRLLCEPIDGPRAEPPSISPNDYLATSSRSAVKRDLGADLDPVQLGLVDEADLAYLFDVVFNEDFQYCPCLSPNIHTPAFVRARSNLLLTAILLLAAQTLPGQALLATRLRAHAAMLQREIVLRRCRSLEIVQALQCLSLWKCAGASAEEDQSVLALAYATVVAVEIGLDKVDQAFLQLEPEIDFEVYKLYVERTAIAVYIWSVAFAMATGHTWTIIPQEAILPVLNAWAARPQDSSRERFLVQLGLLRYETSHIRQIVRQKQLDSTELGRLPTLVMDLVQQGLCSWLRRWQGSRASQPLLPHHDATLLFSYHSCRLWALGLALPYTQLSSDGAAIRLASVCREASLDACAIVVSQGHCMSTLPVNSSILVVYASVMALKLHQADHTSDILPVLGLLAKVADYLRVTGTSPPHRAGPNAIYGNHLLRVLRAAAAIAAPPVPQLPLPPMPQSGLGDSNADVFPWVGEDRWLTLDWLAEAWPADVTDALSWAAQT